MSDHDAFLRTIHDNPEQDLPRLVYADWLEEQGEEGNVLKAEQLRLAVSVHQLVTDPLAFAALDERERARHWATQHRLQEVLLKKNGLVEHGGITINNHFHPVPSLDTIQERLNSTQLKEKIAQGFNQLLLVPQRLPLQKFIDAYKTGILADVRLTNKILNRDNPLWVWDQYKNEPLVYAPREFSDNHQGLSKEQLSPWQVLLVEGNLPDLPRSGEGKDVEGRTQIENGQTPRQYLPLLAERKESGLTPESYIIAALTHLEQTGTPLDQETYSFLLDAYFPSSRNVPNAYWSPGNRRACLSASDPENSDSGAGARVAVRVL